MSDEFDNESKALVQDVTTLVADLQTSGYAEAQIGEILSQKNHTLTSVVDLTKAAITKAYLIETCAILEADSKTSIEVAMANRDLANIDVLLLHGASVHHRLGHFLQCFCKMAADEGRDLAIVRHFVMKIIDWNVFIDDAIHYIEWNLFTVADEEVMRIFLDCGFDIHFAKKYNRSLLPWIFANRRPGVIQLLTSLRGNQANVVGKLGMRPLHIASEQHNFYNMRYLLDQGARPNEKNLEGVLPLTLVLYAFPVRPHDSTQLCIEILLQYGADMLLPSTYQHEPIPKSFIDNMIKYNEEFSYLIELVIAHLAIRMNAGPPEGFGLACMVRNPSDKFWMLYRICCVQLQQMNGDQFRDGLTLFTIVSRTGAQLFGHITNQDYGMIHQRIDSLENMIVYYTRTLKEHMRQFDVICLQNN